MSQEVSNRPRSAGTVNQPAEGTSLSDLSSTAQGLDRRRPTTSLTRSGVSLAIPLVAGVLALICGARPAAALSWSNPHHPYIVFADTTTHIPFVQEVSVDPKPGPTLQLGGPLTRFCGLDALAIGPTADAKQLEFDNG